MHIFGENITTILREYIITEQKEREQKLKWDKRFLNIAKEVRSWSKDQSTKVGAVVVHNKHIISTGYNGFPSNVDDNDPERQQRPTKYLYTVHAEENALLQVGLEGGRSTKDCTLYSTLMPCARCAASIASSGINRVVVLKEDLDKNLIERFAVDWEVTRSIFKETNIILEEIEL